MLPSFILKYLEHLADLGRKETSIKRYSYDISKFLDWLESNGRTIDLVTFKSLSVADMRAYIAYLREQDLSEDTVRRITVVIKRLLVYLDGEVSGKAAIQTSAKRDLNAMDFLTDQETAALLACMETSSSYPLIDKEARDYLIYRNLSIVLLIRKYGLTPSEVHLIDMNDVNFAQCSISLPGRTVTLSRPHNAILLRYYNDIPDTLRPRYRTADPLFVAFYNKTMTFKFDYQIGRPSRLSIRTIQHTIQTEVQRAGLRKITATNLRNSCILDKMKEGLSDKELLRYFGFKSPMALKRYQKYLEFSL